MKLNSTACEPQSVMIWYKYWKDTLLVMRHLLIFFLLAPASIEDEDFGKFQSSLKEVLSFIKYARDKDELKKVLDADESFRHLGREEVDVLNACVGAKIAVKEGEEAVDVCLAIQQMNEEAAQKERISTLFANIKNLMEKMEWSAEQSMDVLSVSDSDRRALWQLLK